MSNQEFEIMEAPLDGTNLVEASAGTGKTWNIEGIFIRLLAEERRIPREILVVTFTEAATQELRERIYKRLNAVIRTLRIPETAGEDTFLKSCYELYVEKMDGFDERLKHLEKCKQQFDEAAISTIHGFCKTVLTDFSHLTRTGVEVDIINDNKGILISDAVDDYWRTFNAGPAGWFDGLLSPLLDNLLSRNQLQSGASLLLRQADVLLLPPGASASASTSASPGTSASTAADHSVKSGADHLANTGEAAKPGTPTSPGKSASAGTSVSAGKSVSAGTDHSTGSGGSSSLGNEFSTPVSFENIRKDVESLHEKLAALRDMWNEQREEIRDKLLRTNLSRYPYDKNFDKWEADLLEFLENPFTFKVENSNADRFGERFITGTSLRGESTYRSDHPVHKRVDELISEVPRLKLALRYHALTTIRDQYRQRCRREGVTTFDDLLRNVSEALDDDDPAKGGRGLLHSELRRRFPSALIDEFQDTDPVQFSIFRSLYMSNNSNPEKLLYLIGDPKQAIYKFRGADLKTYLRAREKTETRFSLPMNFRSAENMVLGVNKLFESRYSLLDPKLTYEPASAKIKDNPFLSAIDARDAGKAGNLCGLHFPKVGDETFTNKGKAESAVIEWVCNHIARSLASARDSTGGHNGNGRTGFIEPTGGYGTPDEHKQADERKQANNRKSAFRALEAGDIAVLVSKHKQAARIKERLQSLGVPAVVSGEMSVFASDDARLVNLLLDALADPQHAATIRTIAASRLMGLSARQIMEFQESEQQWSELLEVFLEARQRALDKGVLAGLRHLIHHLRMEETLIRWNEGERHITNLRHLSELLHAEQQRSHRNLPGLSQWLRVRRNDPDQHKSDETLIRLESDEKRVRILTMHSSKGLQFPIVYAPFLWESHQANAKIIDALYEEEKSGRLVMELQVSRDSNAARLHYREDLEDRVRLVYVAVTRARYRCYVPYVHAQFKSKMPAPLTAILLRHPDARDLTTLGTLPGKDPWAEDSITRLLTELCGKPEDPDNSGFAGVAEATGVAEVAKTAGGPEPAGQDPLVIALYDARIEPGVHYEQKVESADFKARTLHPDRKSQLLPHVITDSYSSLKRKQQEQAVETPAFSDESDEIIPSAWDAQKGAIFQFPKGAHTGNCWHYLFEHMDFTDTHTHDAAIEQACSLYGFSYESWGPALREMVRNALNVPLGQSDSFDPTYPKPFRLGDISPGDTLREMAFLFACDQGVLRRFQEQLPGHVTAGSSAATFPVEYYLKGLIDLVVRSGDMYFIIDYKSDYLGDEIADYDPEALARHMHRNNYTLQYHIYTVALYKYLKSRIPGLDFEKSFGGVAYLYLRGLTQLDSQPSAGNQTPPVSPHSGVYLARPDPKWIAKIAAQMDSMAGVMQ